MAAKRKIRSQSTKPINGLGILHGQSLFVDVPFHETGQVYFDITS